MWPQQAAQGKGGAERKGLVRESEEEGIAGATTTRAYTNFADPVTYVATPPASPLAAVAFKRMLTFSPNTNNNNICSNNNNNYNNNMQWGETTVATTKQFTVHYINILFQ